MGADRLTNGLIRELNKACKELRDSGKCANGYECFAIGWCNDAWQLAEQRESGNDGKR